MALLQLLATPLTRLTWWRVCLGESLFQVSAVTLLMTLAGSWK